MQYRILNYALIMGIDGHNCMPINKIVVNCIEVM